MFLKKKTRQPFQFAATCAQIMSLKLFHNSLTLTFHGENTILRIFLIFSEYIGRFTITLLTDIKMQKFYIEIIQIQYIPFTLVVTFM